MHPARTSNGHRQLDEPVITTRAEIQRLMREEADRVLSEATRTRRVGFAIGDIVQVAAIVWLGLTLVAAGLGLVPVG